LVYWRKDQVKNRPMTGFWLYGRVIGRIDPWIESRSKEKQQSDLTDGA
jgi:hypothetical protein